MTAPVLELQDVGKRFGNLEILRGLRFSLAAGESAAVVGPSGAGKSTMLHIAGLMERPSSGRVILAGRDRTESNDRERADDRLNRIGFLFQFHHLLPEFDVLENVLIPARLAGDDLNEAAGLARGLLERLGLSERLTHRPSELSGGEQQRAALARALIRKPSLLLCDEPTGNLDPHTAAEVARLIFAELQREGVAAILVTHNAPLAALAGRTFELSEGALVEKRRNEAS